MTTNRIGITEAGFRRRRKKSRVLLAVLLVLGLAAASFLLIWGDQVYSIGTVLRVLAGETIKGATYAVKTIRVPRVLVGALAGFAFGVAGNTFQKIMRNSLASPDVMGVTSGASAAAIIAMMVLGLSGHADSAALADERLLGEQNDPDRHRHAGHAAGSDQFRDSKNLGL